MKRILSSCLLLVFPLFLFSQSNFRKAVVINDVGDSLHGYIKDLGWMENPRKFVFTKTPDASEVVNIDLNNSRRVIIEGGDIFQKFILPISMDEVRSSMLSVRPDTSKIVATVFLKVLVEGCNANLYTYTDGIKSRFFCSYQNMAIPHELRYRVYYSDDRLNVVTDKYYQKQLAYIVSLYSPNSVQLKKEVKLASYNGDDLTKIFASINGNETTSVCTADVAPIKRQYQFLILGGIRRGTLNEIELSDCRKLTSNSQKIPGYCPYFGIGLNIRRGSNAKLYYQGALIYSSDKFVSSDTYTEPANYIEENFTYAITRTNFSLSNGLNYNMFSIKQWKLFIGAGFNINYSIASKRSYKDHIYGQYTDYYFIKDPLFDSSQIWISVPLKIGINLKGRIALNANYYLPIRANNLLRVNIIEVGISVAPWK